MIKLYGYGPLWGLTDLSPFVHKVDVYLRLVRLPYELVPYSHEVFAAAPKGKLPCIVDDGEKIADSSFIIEHLKRKYGDPLDESLAPAERATGHAIKRMLEENFYWVIVVERWRETTAAPDHYPVFAGLPPEIVQTVVEKMQGAAHGHGLGRHSDDEVESIGKSDLTALSNFLGEKPFLLGNTLTSYDATAYAFVAHVIQPEYNSRMKRFIKTVPNLMGYWDRLGRRLAAHGIIDDGPPFLLR